MTYACAPRRALLACCLLALTGCPGEPGSDGEGTTGDDGSSTDEGDTTPPPPPGSSSEAGDTTTDEPDGTTLPDFTTGEDATTGDDGGDCPPNALDDPGFEGGTPSRAWDEGSDLFGTVLCDASCGDLSPYAGGWFAWYGGVDDTDFGYVGQSFSITSDSARLSFQFSIESAAGLGDDYFTVTIDDETIFFVTDAEMADYDGYTEVQIDVSAWADGAEHYLSLESEVFGGGLTNFLLDQVEIGPCDGGMPPDPTTGGNETGSSSGSGSGSTGSGSTGSGSGSGSTGSGSTGSGT